MDDTKWVSVGMGTRRGGGTARQRVAAHDGGVLPRGGDTRLRAARAGHGGAMEVTGNLAADGKMAPASRHVAFGRWSEGGFREKIIRRTCDAGAAVIAVVQWVAGVGGVFALSDKPARNGCRGVFFQPLIHQRADLLAEIGGMTQAGQFIALQAVARSGKQKLPRGLGAVASHLSSPGGTGGTGWQDNRVVHQVKYYCEVLSGEGLWKTVEKFPGPVLAFSGALSRVR